LGAGRELGKGFARHDTAVYSMALAYRGLFALVSFAAFLVAVPSLLRADAVLLWLTEQGPRGRADRSRG
jgi:hypothetical protein